MQKYPAIRRFYALVYRNDELQNGTTYSGGANGNGTVFKISLTGTLTTLHSFDGTDGSEPLAGLVQGANGNLHGTTYVGGSKGDGVVFKITLSVHAA
jgi:uncharacterized repeat protein (TIGR03803 family)